MRNGPQQMYYRQAPLFDSAPKPGNRFGRRRLLGGGVCPAAAHASGCHEAGGWGGLRRGLALKRRLEVQPMSRTSVHMFFGRQDLHSQPDQLDPSCSDGCDWDRPRPHQSANQIAQGSGAVSGCGQEPAKRIVCVCVCVRAILWDTQRTTMVPYPIGETRSLVCPRRTPTL